MKIEIHHIPTGGMSLAFAEPASHFPSLVHLSKTDAFDFTTPVAFDISVRKEGDLVIVQGALNLRVMTQCSRCLAGVEEEIRERFTIRFSRDIPRDLHTADTQEIELTAEQIGVVFFKDDTIDLKDTLQEQVVMALPYKSLCTADCKGMCPRCGADLNRQPCDCETHDAGSPFAVLKNMKLPNK